MPDVVVEFRDMLVGPSEHTRFVGTVSERLTVPVKPFTPATVIVELAGLFVSTLALAGLEMTEKSTPETEMVVEDLSELEFPVTVMTALPVVDPAVMVRIAVAVPFTVRFRVAGENLVWNPHVQPVDVAFRLTAPLKLPRLVTVIVEFTDVPVGMAKVAGLADSVKPSTSTVIVIGGFAVVLLNPLIATTYVPELEESAVMVSFATAAAH